MLAFFFHSDILTEVGNKHHDQGRFIGCSRIFWIYSEIFFFIIFRFFLVQHFHLIIRRSDFFFVEDYIFRLQLALNSETDFDKRHANNSSFIIMFNNLSWTNRRICLCECVCSNCHYYCYEQGEWVDVNFTWNVWRFFFSRLFRYYFLSTKKTRSDLIEMIYTFSSWYLNKKISFFFHGILVLIPIYMASSTVCHWMWRKKRNNYYTSETNKSNIFTRITVSSYMCIFRRIKQHER